MNRPTEIISCFLVAPRPEVTPWLEQNIILPRKTSPTRPGKFTTDGRPFMRWILDCWNPAAAINVCAVTAAVQLFKTTIFVLGVAYRIRWDPVPMLLVGPSADWSKRELSEKRLHPIIDENPALSSEKPIDLDHFRAMHMAMRGCDIDIVGANSDTGLAGATCGIVAIDEASKIKQSQSDEAPEAHPIYLAMKRTEAFGTSAFHYLSSTPNIPSHPFWKIVEAGDFTHPAVKCPHCREWFNFELDEDKQKGYRPLVWSPDARNADGIWDREKVIETAHYICPHNGCEIRDEHKPRMIRAAEPDRKNPTAAKNHRSFRINFLNNPDTTFGEAAWQFLTAQSDFFGMQDFTNSKLVRPWEEIDANVRDDDVRKLRDLSDYRRGTIPRRPYGMAIVADVGDYKCEWEVAAIFENGEIAIIDWGTVLTIEGLNELQGKLRYPVAGTTEVLACSQGLVDSRDQKLRVYEMCQRSRGFWWPADGADVDSGHWGLVRLNQYGLDLFTFNTTAFKTALYKNAIKDQMAPRFYIPKDADEDLIHGHSGQQLITVKGKKQWKKIPWDHFGDCSLRAILAKLIFFWKNGSGAPDLAPPTPPQGESFPTA